MASCASFCLILVQPRSANFFFSEQRHFLDRPQRTLSCFSSLMPFLFKAVEGHGQLRARWREHWPWAAEQAPVPREAALRELERWCAHIPEPMPVGVLESYLESSGYLRFLVRRRSMTCTAVWRLSESPSAPLMTIIVFIFLQQGDKTDASKPSAADARPS